MSELSIIEAFRQSKRNSEDRLEAVNALRHVIMDKIVLNPSDTSQYSTIYERVMGYISRRYPPLSQEVQRQMAKKERRKGRQLEKC